ncbi:MAG: agmatine deiminase family protein, partial [Parafilimonas sp.]
MSLNLPGFRPSGLSDSATPKQSGFFFPAEFALHEATWLSWPHKEASWPGKIQTIYKPYAQFIKVLAESEKVRININDEEMKTFAEHILAKENVNMQQVEFFFHPTNDAWCRD